MAQADGYVRIVTQNDTSEAQRSTERLGDTIRDSMDTTPADRMTDSVGGLEDELGKTGTAALKTGDIIKANLASEAVKQGIEKVGEALKASAVHIVNVSDGFDGSIKKIAAATNAGAEELEMLKAVVEQIYADNYGESFEDIAESVSKIKQNLGDLDDKELIEVTESAYALKDVFGYGIDESVRAVRAMIQNFGISAAEAFDHIARGAQNGLDYSGELLDSVSEYSVQFSKMGLSASNMFSIFSSGAENAAWNLDKVGDSVKELAIRAIDGSDTSRQGFEALGLEADSMAQRFAEGGISARVAFQEVISALAEMNDPIAQNTAGINLMGTMWEDMGKDAVLALGDISDSAYDAAGAMEGIKEVNYDNLSESVDSLKRQIDLLIKPIGDSLVPILKEAADTVAEVAEQGDLKEIAVTVGEFVAGTLSLLLKHINLIAAAVAGVTSAVLAFKAAAVITKVIASWQTAALQVKMLGTAQQFAAVKSAALNGQLTLQESIYAVLSGRLDMATTKQVALNTAMKANPAGLIAAGVGLLATALSGFFLSASDASESAEELQAKAKELNQTAKESKSAAQNVHALIEEYRNIQNASDNTEQAKQRLEEIQETLVDSYDLEAERLDLVNGKYEEQIGILQKLSNQKDENAKYAANAAYYADIEAQKNAMALPQELINAFFETDGSFRADIAGSLRRISVKNGTNFNGNWRNDKFTFDAGTSYETIAKIYKEVLEENAARFEKSITDGSEKGVSNLYNAFVKAQSEADEAAKRFQENAEQYNNYLSNTDTSTANFAPGSWIAAEEAAKARKREAERQESLKRLAEQREANKELFKQEKADAKYSYDMGIINAGEYYATLSLLRDKYLQTNSDEWREVNVEVKKYHDSLSEEQKKAYEKLLSEQQKAQNEKLAEQKKAAEQAAAARKQAYSDERSQLEFKLRTNKISEKKYYSELAAIRDKFLDKNSDEWRSAYLEAYDYNQRILQENKDALQQLLNDSADSTLSALDKLVAARNAMTAKLTDFNKTFEKVTENIPETVAVKGEFVITTAEHQVESYKMGADSVEDNIRILEEYGAMLDSLKARGADENTLSSILDMDVSEGMEFGAKLLKLSDSEWGSYFDSIEQLNKTAADISAKYYQDQVDDLRENFIDKLLGAMEGVSSDMYKLGTDAAAEFVEGWNQALGTKDLTISQLMRSISDRSIKSAPTAAQAMAASASASASKAASHVANIPVYIGTSKLADIIVDITNGKIVQTGKNVLMT